MNDVSQAADTTKAVATPDALSVVTADVSSEDRYVNRELSWLAFNARVLEEAENPHHPLLERLRFLSISAKNLDEFLMVRVAGLKAQVDVNVTTPSMDGLSPMQQITAIKTMSDELVDQQYRIWRTLRKQLRDAGIAVVDADELTKDDLTWLSAWFEREVQPILTPMAIDPVHPFPFIPNFGFGLILQLHRAQQDEPLYTIIRIPQQTDRFVRLPGDTMRFLPLERVVSLQLKRLFPGFRILATGYFRIVRDSEIEIDDEAEDLVRNFETALKRRRRGSVTQLDVDKSMPDDLKNFLMDRLYVEEADVTDVDGELGLGETEQLIISDFPELLFEPYTPRFPERIRDFGGNCFDAIKAKDIIVHHPFESFDVVIQFLNQAARDPAVVAIKQTLYRTSQDSPIVKALIEAAEAGKSVTAVVELKARFDEEANIRWARDLERAGAQVVYGLVDLKTHAKISLVVRRESGVLVSYVHFGTGNYHPITARIYTDLSLFTVDPALCRDANRIFNYLTGYIRPRSLDQVQMAPVSVRSTLVKLIETEIEHASVGKPSGIWAKFNSLVDADMIDLLYEASDAGVEIELVIRGICCLRPGVPGLSENIRVKSIVGRFLEHSRIFCFANGYELPSGHAKVFISSADWMTRNLDWRVETMVPVRNATVHRQVLDQIMVANIKDVDQTWELQADGSYCRLEAGDASFSAHRFFMTNPSLSGRGSGLRKQIRAGNVGSAASG